jgi:hypothetical protein
MITSPKLIKADSDSFWKWNGNKKRNEKKPFPVAKFFQNERKKVEELVLGPGVGVGIGCGVGMGFGLVGGIGHGRWPWNHLQLVFGAGIGCGVGVGFGYGQGIGYGSSLESLGESYLSKQSSSDSNKRNIVIQI